MVKSLEFIRPEGIPYTLLSVQFYFENENSHWINLYHAAGMQLVYNVTRICYVLPQNRFYELLQLQNTKALHEQKYNWLIMKGIFEGIPPIKLKWSIENEKLFSRIHPDTPADREYLYFHRMPERGNDIILSEGEEKPVFYHFFCNDIHIVPNKEPAMNLFYLNAYPN